MSYRTCKLKSLEKLGSGSEGKVAMRPLNNFSIFFFFFSENSNFCGF